MASTLSVQLRAAPGARVAVRAGAVRRVPAVRSLTVASASRTTEAAKAAVTGALLAVIAAAPLVDVGAAYAVASPAVIASAEKEGEARLKSCTTEECRSVINALNTKRLAKLKGEPAPSVKAYVPVKKAAAAVETPKKLEMAVPKAAAPKPAAVAAKPASSASSSAAAKAAADKKAAEAKKKAADAKKKAEEARKRSQKSGGTNPLLYTLSFAGKVAFAAGALAAPFIYLKKEDVILDDSGAISTEKAISKLSGAATDVVDALPNKDTVALYGIGALVALGVTDGVINLPLLNVLIGAPVQILGFVTALALTVRYAKEGVEPAADAKALAVKLNALVPEGLPKPLTAELEAEFKK